MNPENFDQPTFAEILQTYEDDIASLRSQLSARVAEVRALRNFAKDCEALWLNGGVNVESLLLMLKMNALLDDDGHPTPLLTGEPGPGGEG